MLIRTTQLLAGLLSATLCGCVSSPSSPSNGSDEGDVPQSCDQSSTESASCEITPTPPSELAAGSNICMQEGGTPGTSCPTTDLVGCCTIAGGEQCYYTASVEAPDAEADCVGGGGTWADHQ
jgi:hypothetical protein